RAAAAERLDAAARGDEHRATVGPGVIAAQRISGGGGDRPDGAGDVGFQVEHPEDEVVRVRGGVAVQVRAAARAALRHHAALVALEAQELHLTAHDTVRDPRIAGVERARRDTVLGVVEAGGGRARRDALRPGGVPGLEHEGRRVRRRAGTAFEILVLQRLARAERDELVRADELLGRLVRVHDGLGRGVPELEYAGGLLAVAVQVGARARLGREEDDEVAAERDGVADLPGIGPAPAAHVGGHDAVRAPGAPGVVGARRGVVLAHLAIVDLHL